MKNLRLLFLLAFYLGNAQAPDIKNFEITANPSISYTFGDRFDFQFDIKGTYSNIDLFIYYKSVSENNLIGLIYWNEDRDDDLVFNDYTLKKSWVNVFYPFRNRRINIEGNKFILIAKHRGKTTQLNYISPSIDSDNDGVPDSQDNCPNEAGPSSNYGCPGNPDLIIDTRNSGVYSACLRCNSFFDKFLESGKRHLIAGGVGSIIFNKLMIKNNGTASSNAAKVDFYFSTDNKLEKHGNNADKKLETVSISNLSSNSSSGIKISISGSDIFGFDANSPVTNGNYYILIDLDANNTNDEGLMGERNNFQVIPIQFNSNPTTTSKNNSNKNLSKNKNDIIESIRLIEIYNFTGNLIKSVNVNSLEEENNTINSLSSGLYIIKTPSGVRKILK